MHRSPTRNHPKPALILLGVGVGFVVGALALMALVLFVS